MKDFKVYQTSGMLNFLVSEASDVRKKEQTLSGDIVSFDADAESPVKIVVDIDSTGWTGCKVTKTGENLLPSEAQDVSNWSPGTPETGGYKFWRCNLPSGTYYIHSPHEVPYNDNLYMRAVVYDAIGGYTRQYIYHPIALDENRDVLGVTIPQGGYLQLERYGNEEGAFTDNLWITISENTPYSAYSGTTITVTFPDEVGTITDGTLTIDYDGSVTLKTGGQTYTLTSVSPIETLIGDNNIWADAGEVSVTYPI